MQQDTSKRRIALDIELSQTPNGFSLKLIDETGLMVEEMIETEKQLAKNTENYNENIFKQIDKLGNTIFYLKTFTNNCNQQYFFPSSTINTLKRNACEKLLILRKENYKRQEFEFKQNDYPYISKNLDYRANVVNQKAEQFYIRHKVEEIEYSVEKTNQIKNIVLMKTKNCIRFALGQCLIRGKLSSDFDQNLYLQDNHQIYKLSFDCKNCIMEVEKQER